MSTDNKLLHTASVLGDLHRSWTPHTGQVQVGKSLFYQGKKVAFVECGRKWGKTDFLLYFLYRMCMMNPFQSTYYIAPFAKQARELIWANSRLQNFLADDTRNKYFAKDPNNSEMRITFRNGSFIKIDGADNYDAYRGINPHAMVYDEFKDHHPKFHEGMEPNLATYQAPLLIVGTPPETDDNLFTRMADECRAHDDLAYFNQPTSMNPHIDKDWLKGMESRLKLRGESDVWQREYMAMRVKGGRNHIFPMFDRDSHIMHHDQMMGTIRRYRRNYDFYLSFDPGTASCFAALFVAIHRYTKEILIVDEIYEKEMKNTSTRVIFPRALEKMIEIYPMISDWLMIYDNAATWFYNEVQYEFGYGLIPCTKDLKKKEAKLSLIKDAYLNQMIKVSTQCKNFMWETENYVRDDKGRIPKENDHLLDNIRYILNAAGYHSIPRATPEKVDPDDMARYRTMHDDWEDGSLMKDPFSYIKDEYYE